MLKLKHAILGLVSISVPSISSANCIPPWETLFACDIVASDARAEFCQLSDPEKHPDLREGYYTFARGADMAELYFETDETITSAKDAKQSSTAHFTPAIGYVRDNYVYSFYANGMGDPASLPVIVRVHSSVEEFTNDEPDNEVMRLICNPETIVIDPWVLIP